MAPCVWHNRTVRDSDQPGAAMPPVSATIDTDTVNDQDLKAKVTSTAVTLQDLYNWILAHQDELFYQSLWVQPDPIAIHNSSQMLNRLRDVLTKIAANISGYHKELDLAARQIVKARLDSTNKRLVHFGSRGDVAIDYGFGYGKALQSKSCFAAGYADVDKHIQKAAVQLTGDLMAAETPGGADRRIVDISIKNSANRWPKTDADNSPLTIDNVVTRIHGNVATYVASKRGYNKWAELTPNVGSSGTQTGPGKYRTRAHHMKYVVPTGPATFMSIDFVVKIRWDHARMMTVPGNPTPVPVRFVATRTELNQHNLPTTRWILFK
jgi:hypothetical protein